MRIHQSRDTKPPARTDNVVALPADRPKPFLLLAIAMSALLLLATAPLTAARGGAVESAATPTIVLVHGAWADETGWNDVVARLHKDGYRTGVVQKWKEGTVTVAYLPAKAWEVRGEYRADKSDKSAFLKSDGVAVTDKQQSFGIEVLYKF